MLGELVGAKGARKKGQGQSQNRKQHFSAGCSTLSPLLLLLRRLVLVAAMGMYARHSRSFLQKWGFHTLSFVRISDLHISAWCAPTKSRTRTASTPSPSLSTYIRQAASCGFNFVSVITVISYEDGTGVFIDRTPVNMAARCIYIVVKCARKSIMTVLVAVRGV